MKLSRLQKYIVTNLYGSRGKFKRNQLLRFYEKEKNPPKKIDQQGTVTRSIERLIDKGLMIGFGRRTQEKWFIDEVQLTTKGKREVKRLFGKQQHLPFKLRKVNK